jgi:hypothetical protein
MGACFLAFCTGILAFGKFEMHYGIDTLRTLTANSRCFGDNPGIRRRVLDLPQRRQDSDLHEAKTLLVPVFPQLERNSDVFTSLSL